MATTQESTSPYDLTKNQAKTIYQALNTLSGSVDKELKENAASDGKWNNYLENKQRGLLKRRDEIHALKKMFE